MSRKLFAIVVGCALLAPALASAHFTECTPGFWKNHPEEFCTFDLPRCGDPTAPKDRCCVENWNVNGVPVTCDDLLDMLNTGGACPDTDLDGDPDCERHDAAEFLNSCFQSDESSPIFYNPCPNE